MRDAIVAIDLETTGLDPHHDRIMEIGAIRFRDGEILDTFETLVDPECPIPWRITQITGIKDNDVKGAPLLDSVLPEVKQFIGPAPVLGHNVRFDLEFLGQHGLPLENPSLDTFALASVLMPDVPSYSLSALANLVGGALEGAHRALNDVYMTVNLFLELRKKAAELPIDVLLEIVQAGRTMPWAGSHFFETILEECSNETDARPERADDSWLDAALATFFEADHIADRPLQPRSTIQLLDLDGVASSLEPDNELAQRLPGYEYRPQQVAMLRSVSWAFNEGQHVLIEAPTGVGKSLGYLIPAAEFAIQNNTRIVISTNTLNLQDQLIHKDIPLLQTALGIPVRAAQLKGRANYLCPRRLAALRRRAPTSPEEMRMLARLLVWLTTNRSGQRSDITLRGPVEEAIWHRLSADDEGCTLERCATQMGGGCPFYQARKLADTAHLLIVNHALLLSDVLSEGHVLPDYQYLIVDEAHHLEDAVTNGLSFRTDPMSLRRQIADLGTPKSGLLGELLRQSKGNIPDGFYSTLESFVNQVTQAAKLMNHHIDEFFNSLQTFLTNHANVSRGEYTQQIRIIDAHHKQADWTTVETHADNLSQFTYTIAEAMTELANGMRQLDDYGIEHYADILNGVSAAARHLQELHNRLNEVVNEPDPNTIYWVEIQPDGSRMSLHAAPLSVGTMVENYLWQEKDTIIMTSATLRTDNSFGYIRERLNAHDIDEVFIDSPFDYKNNTLLYVVTDIPQPNQREQYQAAVEAGILELCRAAEGRALVLFTSYAQLQQTSRAISAELAQDGIIVYDQASGVSRTQLVDSFVESQKSVLFGTRSFWEGVDIPGADLSVLVIVRLPFDVPSNPIFAARSEQFDNPFMQYAVPEAILRFRQGFGRLIRRSDDRGIVAIFDSRVIKKRYGQLFLESLPQCTLKKGQMVDLPAEAANWLAAGDG